MSKRGRLTRRGSSKRIEAPRKDSEGVNEERMESQENRDRQVREAAKVEDTMTFNFTSQAPKGQSRRAWRALESIGAYWRALESTGEHWRALDSSGEHWRALESTGEHWRALESTGEHWRALESAGEHWRALESTGEQ